MDSDFSIDENDEPISDHEEDGPKRKRGVVNTKAYKVSNIDYGLNWFTYVGSVL